MKLILKLDVWVENAYCEQFTQEFMRLVKANDGHTESPIGGNIVSSLISIASHHRETSKCGFEAISYIMSDGAHLT